MKKHSLKTLSVCCLIIMLIVLFPFTNTKGVYAIESEGKSFTKSEVFQLPKAIDAIPQTYEAWIKLSSSVTERGGVIFSNYHSSSYPSISFEVYTDGAPRIYWRNGEQTNTHIFDDVNVRNDSYTHLAITWSSTTLSCYVNGKLKGSVSFDRPNYNMANPMCIGGDIRSGNEQYFKGAIKQVAVYSDVRTAQEISLDMQELSVTDENMICAFNLTSNATRFYDISNNGYDVYSTWLDEEDIDIPDDYAYSFMAIGDTQIITESDYNNKTNNLKSVYDYVLDNVESKKVKHVFGLGDITDNDTEGEWDIAKEQIARLDGKVPYSIIRGNHDIYSAGKNMKKSSRFDQIYGSKMCDYAKQYTYCFEDEGEDFRARNTIHFFSAGNFDYMVVALDYGPSDNVLNWASDIIKEHPYHNVIVTTHAYLAVDGTTLDSGDNCPPTRDYNSSNSYGVNNGDHMWEKFISKHENIVMVMCGHDPHDQVLMTQTAGEKGNIVSQFLIDAQAMDLSGALGMVATFYISENGEDVTVEWYSTVKKQYYKKSNNYSFKLNVIERQSTNTITFNANGGTGTMQAIEFTGTYTLPECTFTAPSGKQFKGWATSVNGEIINESTYNVTADVEFYAIWEDLEHSHAHSDVWIHDEDYHWKECACGDKANITEHADENLDGKCDVCNYQTSVSNHELSSGEIIGIVAGGVVLVGVGGFLLVWFVIKKKSFADFIAIFKKK